MESTVQIEKKFNVPVSKLWEYWTNPELFTTWFGPGEASVTVHSYDVVEGKPYEVLVVETSGVVHKTTGTFKSVKIHKQLQFTWKIHDLDMEESLVTVEFFGDETTSSLRLSHAQLTSAHAKMHEFGWNAAFTKLSSVVTD